MTDIITTVRPILLISQIVGLGPYLLDSETKSLKTSLYGVLYGCVLILISAGNSAYTIYMNVMFTTEKDSYIGKIPDAVLLACGVLVMLGVMILAIIQRNKVTSMVKHFQDVDVEMLKLDIHVPYGKALKYALAAIALLILLMVGIFTHDIILWKSMDFYFYFTYFGPVIYSTLMELQFVSGGILLKMHFALLNDRLVKFGDAENVRVELDRKKIEAIAGDDGFVRNFEPYLTYKTAAMRVTAWDGNFSRFRIRKIIPQDGLSSPKEGSIAKIKAIRKIHSSLCETKELLNNSYSLQLLATIAQAFVIITSNLYMLFTKASSGSSTGHISYMSYSIVWALYRTAELICIVLTCTRASKAANQTAIIVHKLLANDWDATVRNQLKLFSIQLLHRKISFSACGFFTLDMTLLHAIVGAATTYLVILIQFHNSYDSP